MARVSKRLSKESDLPGRAAKAQADQRRGHRAFGVVAAGTWEAAIMLWRSRLHKRCLHTVGNDAGSVSGLCTTCHKVRFAAVTALCSLAQLGAGRAYATMHRHCGQ